MENCANCDAALAGEYCHACGQSAHVHRSIGHVFEEFLHGVWHFDSKAWRTLPLLIFRPGKLTRDYIHGHRARYIAPLALFLLSVFLMFFVFGLAGGPQIVGAVDGSGASVGEARQAAPDRSWTDEIAAQARAGKLKVNTSIPGVDENVAEALLNPDFAIYRIQQKAYKLSFLLVPLSLPVLWLMFCWRRDVTLYDHSVFALYSLSFMSLLLIVVALLLKLDGVEEGLLSTLAGFLLLVPPVHMFIQLRGAYRLSIGGAVMRTTILLLSTGLVLGIFFAFIIVLGLAD